MDRDAVVDVIAAANVCLGVDLENVNVLASQVDNTGAPQEINCDADADPEINIVQNTPQS